MLFNDIRENKILAKISGFTVACVLLCLSTSGADQENPVRGGAGPAFLVINVFHYSKTCLKRPLKNRQNKDLNDKW